MKLSTKLYGIVGALALIGMIVAGVIYWVLSMSSVRKEAKASSARLDVPVS